MSKKSILLFVFLLSFTTFAYANSPGNCPQLGIPNIGPPPPYDFMANGMPYYNGCWDTQNITYHDNAMFCGTAANYWEFTGGGTSWLAQTLVVGRNTSHLEVHYSTDFSSPSYDGPGDQLWLIIDDQTTGQRLLTDNVNGYFGTYCGVRSFNFYAPANLNGHTLLVRFSAIKANAGSHIYVRGVELWDRQ
jgi:hypothetical protein